MIKLLIRLLFWVLLIYGVWVLYSRFDWGKKLGSGIGSTTEKQIGDAIIGTLKQTNEEIADSAIVLLNQLKIRLLSANPAIPADIQLHLFRSKEINAFAIPGHHIVVYTGLINNADSAEEVCGVLAHEMGHVQLNHVVKRLAGELGIGVLVSVVTGNSGVVHDIMRILSSTAFDRSQEGDADRAGVGFLRNAGIGAQAFSGFMLKMAAKEQQPEYLEWISTHPDSRKRAGQITIEAGAPYITRPVMLPADWQKLRTACNANW
jgi:predicted Zn-dependent protease